MGFLILKNWKCWLAASILSGGGGRLDPTHLILHGNGCNIPSSRNWVSKNAGLSYQCCGWGNLSEFGVWWNMLGGSWRIIPVSRWLVTIISKSPKWGCGTPSTLVLWCLRTATYGNTWSLECTIDLPPNQCVLPGSLAVRLWKVRIPKGRPIIFFQSYCWWPCTTWDI